MPTNIIGDINSFAITYTFYDDHHETELSIFVERNNILAFKRNGNLCTTKWNLDELVIWLRNFVDNIKEDPYPVLASGDYAAIKDINARNFDSDNEEEFDAYYDKLDAWNLRHRWHIASSGAILADLYFQLNGTNVEISWNNQDEEDVWFQNTLGGCKIQKDLFLQVMNQFIREYALHWFN